MRIFARLSRVKSPRQKVYEDEDMIIIKDINPQAKIHYLMIPKEHFADITEMNEKQAATLSRMLLKLGKMTDELGLQNGFRIVSNKGEDGCQSVPHLHIHILGGEKNFRRIWRKK
ncbi:MAG: HIT domain-containing protein [Clostridiales bacterium]|nr:MAG: HIT domain-containing protein [Clostridiales bacterium]